MRIGALVAFAFAVASATVLSGCVECARGPPVSARDVGARTDSSGGTGSFTLAIRVVEAPGGAPVEGAGVVVYWSSVAAGDWDGVLVTPSGGVVVVAEPETTPATPDADRSIRMRTGADGVATARVPANRVVGIVAAADGFTEEWVPALAAGDARGEDGLAIPLYASALNVTIEGTWGGPGAATTAAATRSAYAWKPEPMPFGDPGYVARLATLDAKISWSNGATAAGDLGIGVGPSADDPTFVADDANEATPGAHEERLALDAAQLREAGVLGARDAFIGPASDVGYLAPFGLPYTLEIEATFDAARAFFETCARDAQEKDGLPGASVPGWGAIGAVAALGVVAVARRRRIET